jgi:DNA cross-link repair 1A protein
MARNTPKKNHSASGSGSLLNFFQKSDGASSTSTTIKKPAKSAKVDSGKSQGSYSIAVNGKGKGKAIDGTAFDPVVISDDDDIVEVTPAPKKSSVARVRPAEEVEVDDDLPGPSVRKRSPSPQVPPQQSPPNPFPNLPGFKQPPTWPQIVNTADIEEDSHLSDGDGSVKAPSEAGDASDDEDRMQDPEILEDEDFIVYDADEKAGSKLDSTSLAFEADPRGSMGGLDMDMVWDEPEDEGMGMEEEGDDDLSEVIATPPPVSMKRKRGPANEKVDECPVCQRSLKGKPNAVSVPLRLCCFNY